MNDMLKARKFFPFGVGSRSCVGRHFMYDEVANFINEFLKQEVEITLPESYEAVKKIICTSKLDGGLPKSLFILKPRKAVFQLPQTKPSDLLKVVAPT